MNQIIKVACVSGGRESTAMTIKKGLEYWDEKNNGVKIFANTGDDPNGLQVVHDLNDRFGWDVKIVTSRYGNIREYYANKIVDNEPEFTGHALPSQANKDCSQKFKIYAISDYLFERFGKDTSFELAFGMSFSKKEVGRMESIKSHQRKLDTAIFPLIDLRLDREQCGKICEEYMGYTPKRSLCDMCFERTIQDWKDFYKDDPKACMSVIDFEESSKLFKKYGYGLANKPIRKILRLPMIGQTNLQQYETKPCACIEDFCLQTEVQAQ